MRRLLEVGMWLVATCGGCAHAPETAPVEDRGSDPAIAHLRQENNTLKRRVQMLEDRVLMLEGGPSEIAHAPSRASRRETRRDPSRFEAASPAAPVRRAVSLDPLPHSVDPDLAVDDEPSSWSEADHLPSDDAPETSRSYRLVGAHLVEQSKAKRPTPADRSPRSRRGGDPVAKYEAAMAIYRSGDYAQAEQAFDAFARAHPDHSHADNALYWKGEAAYDQEHYAEALAAFTEVIERYGGGNKAPDALLKIGLCYEKVGDLANARDVLTELVAAYPRARASDIARARLVELGA